jgi:hypothetical protein
MTGIRNNIHVEDPSDFDDYSNWIGGFYELAIVVGSRDDTRLELLLVAVWRFANATGPFVRPEDGSPSRAASLNLAELARSPHGVVRLPSGRDVVCGAVAIREDGGRDWLIFYIPLEALGRTDRRVSGYMGEEDAASLEWRRPIDDWLANVAIRAYAEVSFQAAAIGFEAGAFEVPDEAAAGQGDASVVPLNGIPRYHKATR